KNSDVTLIGIPDPKEQDGAKGFTEIKARLEGDAIELRQPVPMAGFTGAAALDAQGHVLGMMAMRNAVVASTEVAAPPVRLVDAGAIREFLTENDVSPVATPTGDAKASVVRIICVRK
ncbi:MAG TPA: peptidoglycan-binding protein, partial [Pseudolabrys sp.]